MAATGQRVFAGLERCLRLCGYYEAAGPHGAELAAIALGLRRLPQVPEHEAPRPGAGTAVLITLSIAALVLTIVKGNDWDWTSTATAASFTGAALIFLPYSLTFGAMLLSVALWAQETWHSPALRTGLAIMLSPLLVPVTSLLFCGWLLRHSSPAPELSAGIGCFLVGLIVYALRVGLEADSVGLTFPTLMAMGTSDLPASSLSTGSGVISMIR